MLGQFAANPTKSHYTGTKHVLRYLHGSSEHGITYKTSDEPLKLVCYVDSDWAGDVDARKSTTGYVLTLAKGAVCWSSKRQSTTALSSTEAEYIAISSAVREVIFLPRLLDELKLPQAKRYATSPQRLELKPIVVCNDNKGALRLTEETAVRPRTKHIEVRYHYAREQQSRGLIHVKYLPTDDMPADGLTKPLDKVKYKRFKDLIGIGPQCMKPGATTLWLL